MTTERWPTVPLGEIAEVYDGPHATPKKTENGPWYLSISSLQNGRVDLAESAHLSEADYPRWTKRVAPRPGDTLFSYETRLGEAGHWDSVEPAALGRRMGLLRPNPEVVEPRFLTYSYLGPHFQALIESRKVQGATVERILIANLPNWPLPLPPLDVQRRIAGVLGNLDELIETNQRLSAMIIEQVHLLGLRFFATSEVQETVALAEIADVQKGYSYKSAELTPGGMWLINLKNVGRDGSFQERGFKPLTATPKSGQIVENGDIIVSQTDLTQSRDVIARPVRVRRCGLAGELVASLDLVIVRPKPPATTEYLLALLSQPGFREHALGYCNGTTVLHMGAKALPEYKAPVLHTEVITDFSEGVRPLLEASDALLDEARELKRTRDELLSLLLSGRVVPEEVA